MSINEFLEEMLDVLQRDDPISAGMALADIEEWDSMAIMGTAAFLDRHFNVRLSMNDFKGFTTVADIAKAAGIKA